MTRKEVIEAFREVASEEFAHIPNEEDIEYVFSEKFNKKMNKLLKKIENNNMHSMPRAKRNVLVLIAAILIIFAGLMSVSAVREPVVNFAIEKFETYFDFLFTGDISVSIEYEYTFSQIPDGFTETNIYVSEGTINKEYSNLDTGDIIIFQQSVTDGNVLSIDNEHGQITTERIDGMQIYIYEGLNQDFTQANWISKTYSLTLIYYGDIQKEDFINLVKLIK